MAMAAGVSNGVPPAGMPHRSVAAALRHVSIVAANGGVVPLQEVERRAIEQALLYTRGDRTTAAQLLGIGRTTLYRKLKEYGYASAVAEAGEVAVSDFPPAA